MLTAALRYAPQGAVWIHRVRVEGIELEHQDKLVARRRMILASYPLDLRRIMRLACECAGLAAWCAGLYLPGLVKAAEHADRGGWYAARVAADTAWVAADTAWASADATSATCASAYAAASAWAVMSVVRAVDRAASAEAAWVATDAAKAATDAAWAAITPGARGVVEETTEARVVALMTKES